jgi:DNA (cytosine-5)-methyltransferase 1
MDELSSGFEPYLRKRLMYPLTVVDLFCGAGGLSAGLIKAGFSILSAIDKDPVALTTYTKNLGDHTTCIDLSMHLHDLPKSTVIVGGPPCQGFSSAGMRHQSDERNSLVRRFSSVVAHLQPTAFIFENVEGFLTADRGCYVFDLLEPLIAMGYRIHLRKINAANYGVPQHRKRVIAIGGLGWNPSFPEPTHAAYGAPGAQLIYGSLPRTPTILDSISDLPPPAIEPPGTPQGHLYRTLEGLDLLRAQALKPGQTMRDLPMHLQHKSYTRRANRRVMDGTPTDRRGGAPTGIRRLRPDEPSKAITGGALAEFLHPLEHRSLTLRECARLQTFPDTFTFCGTIAQQIQLIGNAVPPRLAEILARQLALDIADLNGKSETEGALLSFVPTLSSGYSPVLRDVTDRVLAMFGNRQAKLF